MTNILNHKRLRRTKRNDISISNSDEDDYYLKQKDSIIEEKDEIFNPDFKLDISFHPNFKLTSKKGHFTYYSSEIIYKQEIFTLYINKYQNSFYLYLLYLKNNLKKIKIH